MPDRPPPDDLARSYADPDWCEREYNPRLALPEATSLYGQWPQWAAATRARLAHEADLAYGAHPRETFDLFPAAAPRGALVFIHGGYWRAFSKSDFSWIADALVPAGISVALLGYPLCPEVTIGDIAGSCRRALPLVRERLGAAASKGLVVAGHSAGGYLVAALHATDWRACGQSRPPFTAGLSISGIFDLRPLIATSMNAGIGLTAASAAAFGLADAPALGDAPLTFAYGACESAEFARQSLTQAALWRRSRAHALAIEGRHHFDVIEELRLPGSPLYREVERLLGA
ncbi:MAG: alpha/beta hydrolase [Hyphomicrobiaceae bacterium]